MHLIREDSHGLAAYRDAKQYVMCPEIRSAFATRLIHGVTCAECLAEEAKRLDGRTGAVGRPKAVLRIRPQRTTGSADSDQAD